MSPDQARGSRQIATANRGQMIALHTPTRTRKADQARDNTTAEILRTVEDGFPTPRRVGPPRAARCPRSGERGHRGYYADRRAAIAVKPAFSSAAVGSAEGSGRTW
ncbi:hypothetical protein Lfu02_17120 [Longispora fulva]|nr:hypothetical protein Lfu02_17120 [Longispora fulva]